MFKFWNKRTPFKYYFLMVQTSTKLKMNQNYILPCIFSWKLILTNYHPIIHCYALLKFMEMLWSNGWSCWRSKHAYDYCCSNCLIFLFFLYHFLELGFPLYPFSWYVIRFGIFVTLLLGHFSIMLRLTLIVIMEKFLVLMKIIIWKMMDVSCICASWKYIGSFQNLL
jgi:hypothetical protein